MKSMLVALLSFAFLGIAGCGEDKEKACEDAYLKCSEACNEKKDQAGFDWVACADACKATLDACKGEGK